MQRARLSNPVLPRPSGLGHIRASDNRHLIGLDEVAQQPADAQGLVGSDLPRLPWQYFVNRLQLNCFVEFLGFLAKDRF